MKESKEIRRKEKKRDIYLLKKEIKRDRERE